MALNINGTTGISGVDGSVSAPALTGTDSNTGITFPSADTIKFSTGGVERFAISNSGISGDGSGLTGISAGITMHDSWYVNAGFDPGGSTTSITANWQRGTSSPFGSIGSAMTQSSGVFTFPSTGIYYIRIEGGFYRSGATAHEYLGLSILTTQNNSSYSTQQTNYNDLHAGSGLTIMSVSTSLTFDVTNTSTHKVQFAAESSASGTSAVDVSGRRFLTTFTRLGDT